MNRRVIIALFSVLALTSCIKNDLPKPVVDLYIASLDVEGTCGDIVLDRSTYTATIPLAEETNITAVKFNTITFGSDVITNVNYDSDNSKIRVSKDLNNRVVNMEDPEYITLSYFQSYEWKIVATQTINRIWTVDGQIGATEWDLEGHRAIVKRRSDKPLNPVKTTEVRFGPDNYSFPTISEMPTNFEDGSQNISVSAPWQTLPTTWELIVVPTLAEPEFQYIGAGANVIWIKANAIDGSEIVFKYRKKGEEQWIATKDSWYASAAADSPYNRYEQGYVKAVIRGLEPNTEYEVQGWANTQTDEGLSEIPSKVFEVTTASHYQMPNSNMEQWGKFTNNQLLLPTGEGGPCWYPFSSVQEMFWATGNPGGTILGSDYNLTYPVYKSASPDNVPSDSTSETSAFMGSQNVLNMKFAAGNLFVGHYGKTIGTSGAVIYFGRPVEQNIKPVALRFKVKYLRGGINYIDSKSATTGTEYHIGSKQIKIVGGQPDIAKAFFCLTNWEEPHCIDSTKESTFFDPRTAAGVNGLGYFDSDSTPELVVEHTNEWHTMTLPIEYTNPEVVPTYLVMTFTCSGYGDYFTGSDGSEMFVDDIELLYDLDENNQPK